MPIETAYSFNVQWDWDNNGSFDGPASTNYISNGTFDTDLTGWTLFGGAVAAVSGGKLGIHRNDNVGASIYQTFALRLRVGDQVTVTFDVANPSATDKNYSVVVGDASQYFAELIDNTTITAGTAEGPRSIVFDVTVARDWGTTTRLEFLIVTDDASDDTAFDMTFDNVTFTLTHNKDDIVADVIEIHAETGFSADQLAHVAQVGRCTLVLDNTSRYYSPDNVLGANYGSQWINAPIRLIATREELPFTIWRGFTRSVQPTAGFYGDKRCTVICEDLLGLYARAQVSVSAEQNLNMSQVLNLVGAEVFKTARATGAITFSAEGDEDDQIHVGERTYTLKASVSTTEYEVLIGADAATTARNLCAAINDDTDAAEGVQVYGDNTYKSPQVSAEVDGGVITLTALNRGTLGNSITLSVSTPHRDAAAINVVTSDSTSGTVADTHTANGVYWQIEEVGGVTNPAFDFNVDFAGLVGAPIMFYLLGMYSGTAGHTVRVSAYNYNTTSYDNVGVIPTGAVDAVYTYTLTADHVDGSGNANIRIWHDGLGNATHFLRIDHMNIVATLPQVPTDMTVSDSTLTGGTDGPTGLTDYDTGKRTFNIVGDRWSDDNTNALRAITEAVEGEFGYLWAARSGELTARDKDWELELTTLNIGTLAGEEPLALAGEMGEDIINRATVNFQPRGTAEVGIIAKANNTIAVPGKTAGTRWSRETGYPSSGEADALPGGTKIVRLPFVDNTTGNIVGARDVITPRRQTDFKINDSSDLAGYDYTNYLPPFVRTSIVVTGSGAEITFSNRALDTLYVSDFQVRGLALIGYDNQQVIREDADSIALYQRQGITYNMALPTGENFAEQIAIYLISRYNNPRYRVNTILFPDGRKAIHKSIFPLDIEIGYTFMLGEVQTGIDHEYYVRSTKMDITGMSDPHGPNIAVTLRVKRIDEQTYWILGDTNYGVLGYTTRPGL